MPLRGQKNIYARIYWLHPLTLLTKNVLKHTEVAQSCRTLCDPIDCSPSGSSVHGIFQAIILEWIAISFSRRSSQPRARTRVSHVVDRRFTIWATRQVWDSNISSKKTLMFMWYVNCNSSRSGTQEASINSWYDGTAVKNLSACARDSWDMGSIPGFRRSPGVWNGNPLQYSCLENSMDRGAWRTRLSEHAKHTQIVGKWMIQKMLFAF